MTIETMPRLVLERVYPTTPEVLFGCWTEAEQLKRWFAPSPAHVTAFAEVEATRDGKYRIGILDHSTGKTHIVAGVFHEVWPFSRLVFTWAWQTPGEPPDETLVTVEIEPVGSQSKLVITHERFPHVVMRDSHEKGWSGCLDKLAEVL